MHACIYELWKIVADGRDGDSKVLQEVLADLKSEARNLSTDDDHDDDVWGEPRE